MPWSTDSYPNSFKSLTTKQRGKAIGIANGVLKSCVVKGEKSESKCAGIAIATALARVKEKSMVEENKNNIALAEVTSLGEIIKHFDEGVRGIGVAIDIVHDHGRGAAGWIEGLELGPSSTKIGRQSLWATVKWNEMGTGLIKGETYKYISPEFGKHRDDETGSITENVLTSATLTNRPHIKGMAAVELDENGKPPLKIEILREGDYLHPIYGEFTIKAEEGQSLIDRIVSAVRSAMGKETPGAGTVGNIQADEGTKNKNTKQLSEVEEMDQIRELLVELGVKLEEDADVTEALKAYIATLSTAAEESAKKLEEAGKEDSKALEEKLVEAKKLEEEQAKTKKLEEEKETLSGRVVALEEVNRLSERDSFLKQMIRDGKLRPADVAKFEEIYDKAPDQVKSLLSDGEVVVDLGPEVGTDLGDTPKDEDDADLKAAKTLAAKEDITLEEAYVKVIALGEGE